MLPVTIPDTRNFKKRKQGWEFNPLLGWEFNPLLALRARVDRHQFTSANGILTLADFESALDAVVMVPMVDDGGRDDDPS